jgi:hypothetical protein
MRSVATGRAMGWSKLWAATVAAVCHPRAILDAVRSPKKVDPQAATETFKYTGQDAVVVLNQRGQVVTTYARGRGGYRNPSFDEPGHQVGRP